MADEVLGKVSKCLTCIREIAQSYLRLDDIEDFNKNLEKALLINSKHNKANYYKAILHWKQKQYDEAIISFNQLLKLYPNYAYPYHGLGNVYADLNNYDKAIECYSKAIKIDSQFSISY